MFRTARARTWTEDEPGREPAIGSDAAEDRHPTFAVVRRGYDTLQVDQYVAWLVAAPAPGELDAYLEADRIVADARRLAAEIRRDAARCQYEAEEARRRAVTAAERAQAALDAARLEADRLVAAARERASDLLESHSAV